MYLFSKATYADANRRSQNFEKFSNSASEEEATRRRIEMRQHPAKVLFDVSNYNDAFNAQTRQAAEAIQPPIVITVPAIIDSPTVVKELATSVEQEELELYLDDRIDSDRASSTVTTDDDKSDAVEELLKVVRVLRQEQADFRAEVNARMDMMFEAIRRVAKNTSTGAAESAIKRDLTIVLPELPLRSQTEVIALNERLANTDFEKQMV